jgi:hypothetical protein
MLATIRHTVNSIPATIKATETCFFIFSCFLRGIQAHVLQQHTAKAAAKIGNFLKRSSPTSFYLVKKSHIYRFTINIFCYSK